jgi:hypothetical protein
LRKSCPPWLAALQTLTAYLGAPLADRMSKRSLTLFNWITLALGYAGLAMVGTETALWVAVSVFGLLSGIRIYNLTPGMITPPVGGLLFVTSNLSKVPLSDLVRELKPFLIAHGVVLVILTFEPSLSIWLPRALGFK